MAQQHQRAQSRASTASIHSVATQSNNERSHSVMHNGNYQEQWPTNNAHGTIPHPKDLSALGHQMRQQDVVTEDMLRPAPQMSLHQTFSMDGLHQSVGPVMPYNHHPSLHHALPGDSFVAGASFTDVDSQMMDRDDPDESDAVEAPRRTSQKSASNRTSANNELEMRQLYQASRHRKLEEVAKELHGNERGPNSERSRQVFAMLWYVVFP
jgi:regulatory factor X, other